MVSDQNARLTAARKLTDAKARRQSGRFLAEGAQAVREALARPGTIVELYLTAAAAAGRGDLVAAADAAGIAVSEVSCAAAKALSQTVSPPGLVAVCRRVDVSFAQALSGGPRLVAALVEANDPGNAGTIVRAADAAGADAVVLCEGSVDVYNGKAVRASAGSLFHLDVVVDVPADRMIRQARDAGLQVLATAGAGETDLDTLADSGVLAGPTIWLFGNEARGLDESTLTAADARVRVPIYGRAESLNIAAAATVCLYASARAQRRA